MSSETVSGDPNNHLFGKQALSVLTAYRYFSNSALTCFSLNKMFKVRRASCHVSLLVKLLYSESEIQAVLTVTFKIMLTTKSQKSY